MSYNSDYEVRLATLAKLGGDVTKHYDSVYEIDLAILEATGGGGGGSYTAGSGITIQNNEISVDTTVIQPKLTAGDGVEISGNTISATGGDAIEDVDVLPNAAENKDKIVRLSTDGKLYYVDGIKAIKFTALADNSSVGIDTLGTNHILAYSTDTINWINMTTASTISLSSGDSVYVRGILSGSQSTSSGGYTTFRITGSVKVSGNINTIWDYTANDLGAGFQLKTNCGYKLFMGSGNSRGLTDASELVMPSLTLSDGAYYSMFEGCTGLTSAPAILPATAHTLSETSYSYTNIYRSMFKGCTSLVKSPFIAFENNPGTRYGNALDSMFNGCSNLNEIACLIKTKYGSANNFGSWVAGVSATGTFYKNPEATSFWGTGNDGIPSGWDVIDYTAATPSVEIRYDLGWTELIPTFKAGANITIDSNNNISAVGYTAGTNGSFATGDRNQATSIYSHAEGTQTKATGGYSHSEGNQTQSKKFYSHAEGEGTYADGIAAHAEGDSTSATTSYSHTEGHSTIVSNTWEHAEGQYNNSHNVNSTYGNSGNTQHSVGVGTGNNNRKNAFEIMQNGDIYAYGVGGYVGTNTKAQDATIKTLQEAIPVIVRCTQAEYEQLTPDANTIYLIVSE